MAASLYSIDPPRPVLGAWPQPAAAAADRRWDPLITTLAVYIVAAVGRIHQLFPVLLPLKPLLLSSVAAILLLWFIPGGMAGRDPQVMLRAGPLRWMLLLLLWAILSIPGALWVGGAFQTVTDVLLKAVLMAVVVTASIRGPRDVTRLAGAYFGGIALYSLVVLMRFDVGGSNWRLSHLYYYDANDFAVLAVTAIPLGLHFVLAPAPLWKRAAVVVGLLATLCAFVWTGSRGGFVAGIAVLGFLLVGTSAIPLRWRLGGTLLAVGVLFATASDTYWEKMRTIFKPEDDYNLESQEGRKAIWLRGIGYMMSHPILGVGAGNFPTAEGTISARAARQSVGRGVKWQAAHSSYVQVAAELGFPGIGFFLAMIVTAFWPLVRRPRTGPRAPPRPGPPARPLAQALAGSLVAFAVGAAFLSLAYTEALYVLVALAAGIQRSSTW